MTTYYIDNLNGKNDSNGITPETPKKDYLALSLKDGDRVLFKRGSFYRQNLVTVRNVAYGAYGEGEKPTFCGSTDVSSPSDWEETEDKNVWKCVKSVPGDAGNFVFNDNQCTATFRWDKQDLCSQGDFWDSRRAQGEQFRRQFTEQELLLYSEINPALYYAHIEAVSYNTRSLGTIRDGSVFENLRFINSGVHALAGQGKGVTVRNCDFENIGGCAWNRDLHIRFGNAVEFWTYGEDILIEHNTFKNIYDSCVTHQGPGENTIPAKHFICRKNVFDTYGMAAFEYRDKCPIDSVFSENICQNAGCGFAMLGESLPRKSEIWPQPMGHHIFLWRIPKATEKGNLMIFNNVFGNAPVGAAVYSIISAEAEDQIILENNRYTKNETLLNRFGGKNYSSLETFKEETGREALASYI